MIKAIKKIRHELIFRLFRWTFHGVRPSWLNDGLITSHFFGGKNDLEFQLTLKENRKTLEHSLYNEWRLFTVVLIVKMILDNKIKKKLPFNYVECGGGIGITLLTLANYFKKLDKYREIFMCSDFLIMDTFEGVDSKYVPKNLKSHDYKKASYGGVDYEIFRKRFDFLKNINLIKGSIPDTLNQVRENFFSPDFLHIDMNNPYPERKTFEFFYPKMQSGSVIIFDDYSFVGNSYNEQRKTIDEYCFNQHISKPLGLPTGQGMLIKF
jgi:hypothetical protein